MVELAPNETLSFIVVLTIKLSSHSSTFGYKSFVNTTLGPINTLFPIITPL